MHVLAYNRTAICKCGWWKIGIESVHGGRGVAKKCLKLDQKRVLSFCQTSLPTITAVAAILFFNKNAGQIKRTLVTKHLSLNIFAPHTQTDLGNKTSLSI
jgi:hypothetical protein